MPSCSGHVLESPARPCALKGPLKAPRCLGRAAGREGEGVLLQSLSVPPGGSGLAAAVLLQGRSDGFGVRHLLGQAALLVPQPGVGSRLQQQLHDVQKLAGGSWGEKGKG